MIKKFNINKISFFTLALFFTILVGLFIKELPNKFDQNSINTFSTLKFQYLFLTRIDNLYGDLVYQSFMKTLFWIWT